MLINQRIIWSDNAVLKDLSVELNDLTALNYAIPFTAAQDKLYIGSDLPFNHRHFVIATSGANAVASVPTVEIWNGNSWVSAVDVLDLTATSGATLARNGIIAWTTDRNEAWGKEETTEDIAALSTLKIYNMYWVRISFSANFTSTTSLAYVGHKFAADADLGLYYPDLTTTEVKSAFTSGKTTWDDQHIMAAEEIIRYLRKKDIVRSRNQILDWEQFNNCAIHKVAEIIYSSFGKDYEDNRKLADAKFMKAINLGIFQVDRNEDGKLDPQEQVKFYGLVRR